MLNFLFQKPEILGGGMRSAAVMAGDTLLWQMFASVVIPGFTINRQVDHSYFTQIQILITNFILSCRICWLTGKAFKMSKIKGPVAKWTPTLIGLISIPFIIHPIDHAVDQVMDVSYRKYVK